MHRSIGSSYKNLGCGIFKGALCSPRGVPGRGEAPSPRLWLGRVCSPGLWWALWVERRREGREPRPSPRRQQERRLCGVRGALRVASSPACPPSLLWRHPAPGPDPALGCRLLHSRVPLLPHPPLLRGRPLPSEPFSGRLPAAVLKEPLAARVWGTLRPEDAQASRSWAWFLCLRYEAGFCFFETEFSISFLLFFCVSPSLFYLLLTLRLSPSSSSFSSFLIFYLSSF